jgi:hypothetical protein
MEFDFDSSFSPFAPSQTSRTALPEPRDFVFSAPAAPVWTGMRTSRPRCRGHEQRSHWLASPTKSGSSVSLLSYWSHDPQAGILVYPINAGGVRLMRLPPATRRTPEDQPESGGPESGRSAMRLRAAEGRVRVDLDGQRIRGREPTSFRRAMPRQSTAQCRWRLSDRRHPRVLEHGIVREIAAPGGVRGRSVTRSVVTLSLASSRCYSRGSILRKCRKASWPPRTSPAS